MNAWAAYLLSLFDDLALEADKDAWLEKTPMHLHYIDLIEANTQDVFFLHVIREPVANVAALVHVGRTHPDQFVQDTVEKAVKRYRREIQLSERNRGKPNHCFVHYESMLEKPEEVVRDLDRALGLPPHDAVREYTDTAARIRRPEEDWKSKNTGRIHNVDKVAERLSDDELAFVKHEVRKLRCELLKPYE